MTNILRPPTHFISLHSHSHFSTYDGLGQPSDHIDFCVQNGLSGWSLTDHGNGNGLAHAHAHAKKIIKSKGHKFRQLYGVEFYFVPDLADWKVRYDLSKKEDSKKGDDEEEAGLVVEDADETRSDSDRFVDVNKRYHLVVVAKNNVGLSNLFTLVKKSYVDGFYKFPRIDFKLLKEHGAGLVVSTACVGGYPSGIIYSEFGDKKFAELDPSLVDDEVVRGRIRNKLENVVDRFVDCVGHENFFLELQFNKLPAQDLTNRMMIETAASTGCKLLSTADSHYPEPALWEAREIYRQLQPGRMKIGVEPKPLPKFEELKCELYPKNAQQMWDEYLGRREAYDWYKGTEDVVRTSMENGHDIAWNLCEEIWFDTSAKLPTFGTPEKSGFKQLVDLVKEGLVAEGLDKKPDYVARAKMELDDIKYLKSEDYFLTLQKVFKLAENRTLPGSGRGSGAGSLVNYLLGITHVDPLKYDLLWERFMGRHRCLDPATLVKMSSGDQIPISSVNVGDEVVTGHNRSQKVKSKFVTKHKKLMKLTIGNQIITCSPNHRWIVLRDGLEVEVTADQILTTDLIRKL
jgi:DNA polymerase III alpha subunit